LHPWDFFKFVLKQEKSQVCQRAAFFSTLGFHDSGQAPMNSQTISVALLDNKRFGVATLTL